MAESTLAYFFMAYTDPLLLFLTAAGTFAGIYVGAIPGLSVTMAVSILISFTFYWEVNNALALMVGIYCGGVYGGSRSAILLNIPGAPAAIATSFDGFPLAERGEAGRAIGVSTVVSVVGGMVGIIVLAVAAPIVAEFALKFAPRDYLLLAAMGLLLVGSLSGESMAKGVFAGALGVTLGMVGMDPLTAEGRFTFGTISLLGGIHYVVAMIGLFGVSEALFQLRQLGVKPVKQDVSKIIPSWSVIFKYLPLSIRTSLIGVIIGALPGTGGDIASLMAYDHAKRTVKKPSRPFGKGSHADDRNTASVLVYRRKSGAGQYISPGIRTDRDSYFCQDGGVAQGNPDPGHHRFIRNRHLYHSKQHRRCLLDAGIRDFRLLSEDVRFSGGPDYSGSYPGPPDGHVLPAGHDGRRKQHSSLFSGSGRQSVILRTDRGGHPHADQPDQALALVL
jgi:hypothetical protein